MKQKVVDAGKVYPLLGGRKGALARGVYRRTLAGK